MAEQPESIMSVADMSSTLDVPRPYLRRIMQTLVKHGLLISFRGKGGGFLLNQEPDQIRLSDVIAVFQGSIDMTCCLLHGELCPNRSSCRLRRVIKDIECLAVARLRETTIASLIHSDV